MNTRMAHNPAMESGDNRRDDFFVATVWSIAAAEANFIAGFALRWDRQSRIGVDDDGLLVRQGWNMPVLQAKLQHLPNLRADRGIPGGLHVQHQPFGLDGGRDGV